MSNFERLEEKASLYVLGELDDAERRDFEGQMDDSIELLELVRDLEDGATAIALASPPQCPPAFLWKDIERAVDREKNKVIPFFRWDWRNSGWAAAAACLAAWLFFGVYRENSRSGKESHNNSNASVASNEPGPTAVASSATANPEAGALSADQRAKQELEARERETLRLRNELTDLQRRVGLMSQALAQQQAMLNESSRMKLVTLTPMQGVGMTNVLSPQLQRALFLAMARELGWLGSSNEFANPQLDDGSRRVATNSYNVDFVDFRGPTNGPPTTLRLDKEASDDPPPTEVAGIVRTPAGPLPAFVSGDHVVVALDNTVAAPGAQLSFNLMVTGAAALESLGTTVMGNDPLVITLPLSSVLSPGWVFTITTVDGINAPNVIEFIATPNP